MLCPSAQERGRRGWRQLLHMRQPTLDSFRLLPGARRTSIALRKRYILTTSRKQRAVLATHLDADPGQERRDVHPRIHGKIAGGKGDGGKRDGGEEVGRAVARQQLLGLRRAGRIGWRVGWGHGDQRHAGKAQACGGPGCACSPCACLDNVQGAAGERRRRVAPAAVSAKQACRQQASGRESSARARPQQGKRPMAARLLGCSWAKQEVIWRGSRTRVDT